MVKIKTSRGIAITASVLLLSSVLLYLTLAISAYANSLIDANAQLSRIELVNSELDNAAYGLRVIELGEAVNVSFSGNNITFAENTTKIANYSNDAQRWASFVAGFSPANVSINTTEAMRPKLYVRGKGIEVDNAAGRITFSPQSGSQSAGNVSGYDISIWINRPTPRLNWTALSNISIGNPNGMLVHIGLQGTNGTVSDTRYLNKSAFSELKMLDGGNSSLIVVQANSSAALKIFYNMDIYIKTVLQLSSSGSPPVELGSSAANVTAGNANAVGSVIVGEG